jgi:hypothetical protein
MNIERALQLKAGDKVYCPPDRGDKSFIGEVKEPFTGAIHANSTGEQYVWVSVKGPHHTSTWPSNRLDKA